MSSLRDSSIITQDSLGSLESRGGTDQDPSFSSDQDSSSSEEDDAIDEEAENLVQSIINSTLALTEYMRDQDRYPEDTFKYRIMMFVYAFEDLAQLVSVQRYQDVLGEALDDANIPLDTWTGWKAQWGTPKPRVPKDRLRQLGLQEIRLRSTRRMT